MINLPTDLPSELVPLSWLLGVWEGTGVVEYSVGEEQIRQEFGQRVSFSHDGLPYLNYSSHTWIPEGGDSADPLGGTPLLAETGYSQLPRRFLEGDPRPGMLPALAPPPYSTAAPVETLRHNSDVLALHVSPL